MYLTSQMEGCCQPEQLVESPTSQLLALGSLPGGSAVVSLPLSY